MKRTIDTRLEGKRLVDQRSNWRGVNSEDDMEDYFQDKTNYSRDLRIDEFLYSDGSCYYLYTKKYGRKANETTFEAISQNEAKMFILGELDEEVFNKPHYEILASEFGSEGKPQPKRKSRPSKAKETVAFNKKNVIIFSDTKPAAFRILEAISRGELYLLRDGKNGKIFGVIMSPELYEKYNSGLKVIPIPARVFNTSWNVLKDTLQGHNGEAVIGLVDTRTTAKEPVRYILSFDKFKETHNIVVEL